jgi:hypothetical protein
MVPIDQALKNERILKRGFGHAPHEEQLRRRGITADQLNRYELQRMRAPLERRAPGDDTYLLRLEFEKAPPQWADIEDYALLLPNKRAIEQRFAVIGAHLQQLERAERRRMDPYSKQAQALRAERRTEAELAPELVGRHVEDHQVEAHVHVAVIVHPVGADMREDGGVRRQGHAGGIARRDGFSTTLARPVPACQSHGSGRALARADATS